ncbi:DUF3800 domain-containing protein [Paludisphaera rhizosphaerae]|uniref:DUF3800 domain-containing protein n=1 Tax=Paludisphaera rhizosphaerae TaxID=2711216 RepID=UPI002105D6C8|nr:DUF3800 domain-containing protein [Paludisphaera rhizosphaerae]
MYLLYLDASGTPLPQDVSTKHYVLVGLCMPESAWFGLDERLQTLKRRYCFPSDDLDRFELHVKQFAVTYEEQRQIPDFDSLSHAERRSRTLDIRRQKLEAETDREARRERRLRYAGTEPFIHLSRRERSQLLEDAVDLIAGHENIRLFGEGVCKAHPAVVEGRADAVRESFTQVVSRFDTFLQKKDNWKLQRSPRRSIDYGLLILDQDESTETTIEQLFKRFRTDGHPFGKMTHVIDVPFFASSAKVGGLQIVDVAAYVVRRYFDKAVREGTHEERQFQKIFQRFDRDTYGRLHGLRHYVPMRTCNCLVCQERGHSAPIPPA